MRIHFAGAGPCAEYLSRRLIRDDHEIVLLEQDEARVHELSENLDASVVQGDVTRMRDWQRAGLAETELFIACARSDQTNLVFLALAVTFIASLTITAMEIDLITAVSAVIACEFNIGPGLGAVGSSGHYGDLPDAAKGVLAVCMIAGRLEFYTLLVIMTRAFWRS